MSLVHLYSGDHRAMSPVLIEKSFDNILAKTFENTCFEVSPDNRVFVCNANSDY